MRVDFMMIGAQKAGTTSLAAQLAAHPQICFCREKEPGYFHKTDDWTAGLDQYHSLYSPTPGQLCGEASTYYTFFPEFCETHKRLYDYNPALKLIYVVRQPVHVVDLRRQQQLADIGEDRFGHEIAGQRIGRVGRDFHRRRLVLGGRVGGLPPRP